MKTQRGGGPRRGAVRPVVAVGALAVVASGALVGSLVAGGFGRTVAEATRPGGTPIGGAPSGVASTASGASATASPTELSDPAVPTPATPGGAPPDSVPAGTPTREKPAPAPTGGLPTVSPRSGTGRTTVLPLAGPDSRGGGRPVHYSVELEDGLGIPPGHVAATVHHALTDPRGWQSRDGVRFVGVGPKGRARGTGVDVRLIVASPEFVDRNCLPLRTMGELSCRSGNRVLLNVDRYLSGIPDYGGDLEAYRIYLVNHEVGHVLGHGHVPCPGPGRPAPVMMQQSKGLQGCTSYPYPVPPS